MNFYYDDIPNEKFLNVELIFDSNPLIQEPRVVFELKNNSGIGPEQFSLITSHYKELGLLNELSEYVEEELSNLHDEILHNTHLPREEHIESLRRKKTVLLENMDRTIGSHHFMKPLLKAMSFLKEYIN